MEKSRMWTVKYEGDFYAGTLDFDEPKTREEVLEYLDEDPDIVSIWATNTEEQDFILKNNLEYDKGTGSLCGPL